MSSAMELMQPIQLKIQMMCLVKTFRILALYVDVSLSFGLVTLHKKISSVANQREW